MLESRTWGRISWKVTRNWGADTTVFSCTYTYSQDYSIKKCIHYSQPKRSGFPPTLVVVSFSGIDHRRRVVVKCSIWRMWCHSRHTSPLVESHSFTWVPAGLPQLSVLTPPLLPAMFGFAFLFLTYCILQCF